MTRAQINTLFPFSSHYVADLQVDNAVTYETMDYLVVYTKTGTKNKYGGDVYAAGEIYFVHTGAGNYAAAKNPY